MPVRAVHFSAWFYLYLYLHYRAGKEKMTDRNYPHLASFKSKLQNKCASLLHLRYVPYFRLNGFFSTSRRSLRKLSDDLHFQDYTMNMLESKYSAAFTAAALLYEEHLRMGAMLLGANFEESIGHEVANNTILGIKTEAGRKRTVQEIKKRYAEAPEGFWNFFFSIPEAEQRLALFFLCLKTYPLMLDYHVEVTLKKWRSLSLELELIDLQMRLDEIEATNPEVADWSESTKRKTLTVYTRVLREAGLYKDGQLVKPSAISADFWAYFAQIGEAWFIEACFHPKSQL